MGKLLLATLALLISANTISAQDLEYNRYGVSGDTLFYKRFSLIGNNCDANIAIRNRHNGPKAHLVVEFYNCTTDTIRYLDEVRTRWSLNRRTLNIYYGLSKKEYKSGKQLQLDMGPGSGAGTGLDVPDYFTKRTRVVFRSYYCATNRPNVYPKVFFRACANKTQQITTNEAQP